MTDLPTHIEFEYIGVLMEEGDFVWKVTPFKCISINEESQELVWEEIYDESIEFQYEEDALLYIKRHGKLVQSFQCKLN